jgi:hypothetical protein
MKYFVFLFFVFFCIFIQEVFKMVILLSEGFLLVKLK